MRSLMNNMHSTFSKDSLVLGDVHSPRRRPAKRDIATLYSTDMSYQLQKSILIARDGVKIKSDDIVLAYIKPYAFSR